MGRPIFLAAVLCGFLWSGAADAIVGDDANAAGEQLTDAQQAERVAASLKEIKDIVSSAEKALEGASASKEKTECISGKLTSLRALASTAEGAKAGFQNATTPEARAQKLQLMSTALTTARGLGREVSKCAEGKKAGQGQGESGQSKVETSTGGLTGSTALDTGASAGSLTMPDIGAGSEDASASE
jgi:hypothetical protein